MHGTGTVEVLTAEDAEARQRRIAGGLAARGLRAGDRVALATTSGGDMLAAVLGALRTGVVPVLLNAGLLEGERRLLLEDADPALVVDDADLADLLEGPPADLAPWPLARPMHYTSGTTGRAKGVWSGVLSEGDASALLAEERELWGFAPDDVHLVNSPFHHSVAIRFAGGTLLAGGTVVVQDHFDARVAARAVVEHRPTTTFLAPAHLQRLFALGELPDASSLRLVAHAGSACPPSLKHAAIGAFGAEVVWEFYGSTEGQFTACSSPEWLERPGTVGRARRGRHLAVDEDGTIWCEVPRHARFEYWRDPSRTAEAWRPARPGSPAHGAFTVGDLGRLDDDGYLFIDGRRDDLVISGGVNVYPAEVEAALAGVAGVDEVAVFGRDDERWGQRVCVAYTGDADDEALRRAARERLAPYKRPKEVTRLDRLPRTATGKVQRLRLPALVDAARSGGQGAGSSDDAPGSASGGSASTGSGGAAVVVDAERPSS